MTTPRPRRRTFFIIARMIMIFFMGLVVAVVVALSQLNLETLRGNIATVLSNAFGVPVEIEGPVSWKLSLRPRVELNNVYIKNAEWAHHEYAFSAKKIDVRLNLISLFSDRPTVQFVRVYDASVCLEQNAAGKYSVWPKLGGGANPADADDATKDVKPAYPFEDPGLGMIEIKNLDADILGNQYSLSGINIRYVPRGDSREYGGWLRTANQVFPFIVSFSQYNAERKVYPVRVAVATGGDALIANIALEGTSLAPIDFIIKGDLPDAAAFGEIVGMDFSAVPALSVNIAGGFDWNKLSFRKSSVAVRGVDITFSGDVVWGGIRPSIKANVETSAVNLVRVVPELYGTGKWVRPNRELNVFKDIPLYGTEFLKFNADVTLKMAGLTVYRDLELKDLNAHIRLHDGIARFDASTGIADGTVQVAADIDIASDGVLDVTAGGIGERIYIGEILNQVGVKDIISELPVNIEFYLRGHGADLSGLMATLNGPVSIYSVARGYAHSSLVSGIYGTDFLTSLRHSIEDLFRSEKKHDQMKISCIAVNAKFRDGRIDTENGVALETNAINVRLAGNVDLGQESMRMALTTVPVRGLKLSLTGSVVNSIEISGNLAEPDIQINGAAVAGKVASATGLGLLLAPLTGGIGLVAGAGVGWLAGDLLENWLADDEPCKTARTRGAPAMRGDAPWINAPLSELVGGILNNKGEK